MSSPITVPEGAAPPATAAVRRRSGSAPVVIEARGLSKSFRVPEHRVDSLKERAVRPFTRGDFRELRALDGISFDVHRGEFFGIVGRNGSGKSTLLKILASIYRADAGRIRMAGRMAPFIELGVGFNAELSARDNAVLNGVLMGLSKRESRRRLDAVLEFAELEEFSEVKLKNYSSGMMVRLAFAVMVQADADIMLVDEVLAVGDAAFAQKCLDVFHAKRDAGKTVVLVTHDMESVQSLCDRAMLIQDGEMRYIGDPEDTAIRYYRLNFAGAKGENEQPIVHDLNARLVHAHLESAAGERVENVEQGEPIVLDVLLEARQDLVEPTFGVVVLNAEGEVVFGFRRSLDGPTENRIFAGRQVRLSGTLENPLVPGRYSVDCWVHRIRNEGDAGMHSMRLLDFVVYGTGPRLGVVTVRADVAATLEPDAQP